MAFAAKLEERRLKYRSSKTADFWISTWTAAWFALRRFTGFLKAKSRAKKSASKVKIGQIVDHTVLILKRARHLGYPDYVICYGGSKSAWDANIGFQYRALYEPSFANKHR